MSQGHLSAYTRKENQSQRLVFDGAIDIATAPQALAAIQRLMAEQGPDVVLDVSRVNFIDSKGLGTLLAAAKQARDAGGQIYLANPALPVQKILEACQLTAYFPPPPPPEPVAAAPAAPANGTRAAAERTAVPRTRARQA